MKMKITATVTDGHRHERRQLLPAAALIASLTWITSDTCRASTPQNNGVKQAGVQHSCEDFAQIREGAYLYVNNMWGAYQQPKKAGWFQCLDRQVADSGKVRYLFTWHWPYVEQPLQAPFGFPGVSFGKNPNFPGPSTTSRLPAKVDAVKKISATADTLISTSGAYDEFYNIFYVSNTDTANIASSVTTELAVVIRHHEQSGATGFPFQQHVKDIVIGDQRFGLYVNPAFTPPKATPRVLAFLVPERMPLRGTVDIKAITRALIAQHYVHETDYIANVDLGVETYNSPKGSNGRMEIGNFSVAIEPD